MDSHKDTDVINVSNDVLTTVNQASSKKNSKNTFKCNVCSKIFSNSSAIAKHRLTHSEERKYVCAICKKAFKRQDHLNGHKLTHETKRPHGCRFCEKSYSDSRSLRRHYDNAHVEEYEKWKVSVKKLKLEDQGIEIDKELLEKCEIDHASAKFVKAIWMSYSLEEPKRVSCQVCGKRFKNQPALNGHMRLHGGYSLMNEAETSSNQEADSAKKTDDEVMKKNKKMKIVKNVPVEKVNHQSTSNLSDTSTESSFNFNSFPISETILMGINLKGQASNSWLSEDSQSSSLNNHHQDLPSTKGPFNFSLSTSKSSNSFSELSEKEKIFHQLVSNEETDHSRSTKQHLLKPNPGSRRRHESGYPQFPGFTDHVASGSIEQYCHEKRRHSPYIHVGQIKDMAQTYDLSSQKTKCHSIESATAEKGSDNTPARAQIVYKNVAYFGNKPLPCSGPFGAHYSPITPAPDNFPQDSTLTMKAGTFTDRKGISGVDRSKNIYKPEPNINAWTNENQRPSKPISSCSVFDFELNEINNFYPNDTDSLLVEMMDASFNQMSYQPITSEEQKESCYEHLVHTNQPCLDKTANLPCNEKPTGQESWITQNNDTTSTAIVQETNESYFNASKDLSKEVDDQRITSNYDGNSNNNKNVVIAMNDSMNSVHSTNGFVDDKHLPKKKRRPTPLYIPPNVTGNMSRLRTPLLQQKPIIKDNNFIAPYTPPPMLSPNRKGTGLFYNLKKRKSIPSSSVLFFRTNSEWQSTDFSSDNSQSNVANNSFKRYNNMDKNIIKSCQPFLNNNKSKSSTKEPKSAPNVNFGFFSSDSTTLMEEDTVGESIGMTEPQAFTFNEVQLDTAMDQSEDDYESDEFDDGDGVPSSSVPMINIGDDFQAVIPTCHSGMSADEIIAAYSNEPCWEKSLWFPENFNDEDPKNKDSLDLLMKIACSAAVRNCGLNMEYAFHLLCKYKGDLEKTLQSLLRDCLVVYDYVYAETTVWSKDEILKFQDGLNKHGRDFYLISKEMNSSGINKSVKSCVEFYYVWKRMNNPAEVKKYRSSRNRRERQRKTAVQKATAKENNDKPLDTPNIDILTVDENKPISDFDSMKTMKKDLGPPRSHDEICLELVTQTSSSDSLKQCSSLKDPSFPHHDNYGIIIKPSKKPSAILCEECGEILQDEHICVEWMPVSEPNSKPSQQLQHYDPCKYCNRVFYKAKNLNTHIKMYHSKKNRKD